MKTAYGRLAVTHLWGNITNLTIGTITTAFSLVIMGSFLLVYLNLSHLTGVFFQQNHYSIFIEPSLGEKDKAQIRDFLSQIPNVIETTEITPTQAKAELLDGFTEARPILEKIPFPNLPYLIEFTTKTRAGISTEQMEQLKKFSGVQDVFFGRETQDQINNFFKITNFIGAVLLGMLLISIAFIIRNSTLLAVRIRFKEIEILRALGATPGYIRTPFLAEGAATAIFSFIISKMFLYLMYVFVVAGISYNQGGSGIREYSRFFTPSEMLVELAIILCIGVGSSLLATNLFLNTLDER